MPDLIANIHSNPESISTAPVQPSSQNPATAEAAAMSNGTKKDFSINTGVKSVGDLRKEAPEVYEKMMMGIAQTIVSRMREHAERLKKLWRENRTG